MVRRLFDISTAGPAFAGAAPLILAAAIGVKLSSRGPAFYKATRIGRHGRPFTMYKLRTMHVRREEGSSITAAGDARVFLFGRLLRFLKVDELPQLWNILRGDMAVVGPRPEAPDIVERHYTAEYRRSLAVPPGLTSPGSIFYYTHGEQVLAADDGDAEELYIHRLLPQKMAVDLAYLNRSHLLSDIGVIVKTAVVLLQKAAGRTTFPDPTEPATCSAAQAGKDTDRVEQRRAA